MIDFEFESDEEELLGKAVREILEKRRQKIASLMQTTTCDDLQIIVSHEPNSNDGESRPIGNAEKDDMVTEDSDDESTDDQIEENQHLVDRMNDEEMASKPDDSTDEYDLTPEFSELADREEIRSDLNDSSIGEGGISISKISLEEHEIRGRRIQFSLNSKKFEVIMNGEEGKEARRELTLMDYHGKHKLNLIDENINIHPSGYGYQIYLEGQVIDKYIHSDCYFRKPGAQKAKTFFHNLLQHIGGSFVTYLCRFCFHIFCYRSCIHKHLNFHKRSRERSQNSWNQPDRHGSSIVARKFTKNKSEVTLINSKTKCELNITDEYINRHRKTGHEYQIYYRGQAINKEDMEQVVKKNATKDAESGKLLCGVHRDCLYSDPEKLMKKHRAQGLHNHIRYALMIYLCRSCFNALGSYPSLLSHFKIHTKSCIQ
ncbi:uncharacterized protein LOC141856240 isoform X2 [Brevipalpus obovatus]|uniref:uncharacterized protein LOC141856240 isoform X2 n=1 Tax=Brevipalpus obovatus TaxID=246614 RepID=UPI003D9E44AD